MKVVSEVAIDNKQTVPFVYKWTELSSGKWYIGAHFSNGCHPDDGYLCSSKIVRPLIASNPENWRREILEVCESPQQAKIRESEILTSLDAASDPMSYNQSNSDGKFSWSGPHSVETRAKMSKNHKDVKGSNNPMFGKPGGMKGKKHKESSKLKTSAKLKGRLLDNETKSKITQSLTGLSWINNGVESKRIDLQQVDLPEGWQLGMLQEHTNKLAETRRGENHWLYGQSHKPDTKQKISQALKGRVDSPEIRLRKKAGNAKRKKVECHGCGKFYLACHRRHHLKCTSVEKDL